MNLSGAVVSALPLGLVTGLHCAGMCGSMILAVGGASAPGAKMSLKTAAPHLLYHAGRALTYASIGAAVGAFGTALSRWGAMIGFHQLAMAVSIGIMVMVGLHLSGIATHVARSSKSARMNTMAAEVGRAVLGFAAGGPGAFTLGALTGFLPCAPLYAAFGLAMSAGGPVGGLTAMLLFWAGTLPPLLALGFSSSLLLTRLRRRTGAVIGIAILAAAIAMIGVKIARAANPVSAGHCGHGAPSGLFHHQP